MKSGEKVSREGWNGKGMWLGLVTADQYGLGSNAPYDYGLVGNKLLPWIGMKTADGAFVPWLASQTDILAMDWGHPEIIEVVENPNATPLPLTKEACGDDPLGNFTQSKDWGVSPFIGVMIRMGDKVARLQSFIRKGSLENESVQDTLIDLAAYSLLAYVILEREKPKSI